MNEISFFVELTPNASNRIRVKAFKETGKVLSFVVQYESKIKGSWKAIVRYEVSPIGISGILMVHKQATLVFWNI